MKNPSVHAYTVKHNNCVKKNIKGIWAFCHHQMFYTYAVPHHERIS